MSTTLKERHETRRLHVLQEKLERIDEDARYLEVLSEAFDKEQSKQALDLIKQLKKMDFGNIEQLKSAREAALADITKVLSGGGKDYIRSIANFAKRITGKGQQLADNPFVTALAFVDGIHNFFEVFNEYVTSNYPDAKGGQTLGQLVSGLPTSDDYEKYAKARKVNDANNPEVDKRLEELQKIIVKGIQPDSPLTKLGRNWVISYLGGKEGIKKFASELMSSKVNQLQAIGNTIKSSFPNIEPLGDSLVGKESAGTTAPATAERSEPASVATPSKATGGKGSKGAVPQEKMQAMASKLAKDMDLDVDDVVAVIRSLNYAGKLKEALERRDREALLRLIRS